MGSKDDVAHPNMKMKYNNSRNRMISPFTLRSTLPGDSGMGRALVYLSSLAESARILYSVHLKDLLCLESLYILSESRPEPKVPDEKVQLSTMAD